MANLPIVAKSLLLVVERVGISPVLRAILLHGNKKIK